MPPYARELQDWIRSDLFDAVPMSISVISRNYRIVEANRTFAESFGDWRGRACYEVYKGRAQPCPRCGALEAFVDGRSRTREESGVVQGGLAIDYLVHLVPLVRTNGEIPYVIEMCTDITAVKRLEREKREAERLAAVGETVAGIAHGIKNVLMGLEGGMYAVNTGIARGDDQRIASGWATLEENVGRISEFVKEFLDFAKGRETDVRPVDPDAPARAVAELFRDRAAQVGVRLETRLAGGPLFPLDEEGVHACLSNLVSNAIDACTMADQDGREFVITLASRAEEDTLVYEVADNGAGMDYEISRKVFSKFFTTKGSDRGTGLGLLTTKRIVHQHGGQITFETQEGEGSVFRITLPRHRTGEAADEDRTGPTPLPIQEEG